MICGSGELRSAPCIVLKKCKHVFHLSCALGAIASFKMKGAARISFEMCKCPLCHQWMDHPALDSAMAPVRTIFKEVEKDLQRRVKEEKLDKHPRVSDPSHFEEAYGADWKWR